MAQMLVQLPTVRRAISEGASVAAGDLVRMLAPLDDALADAGIEPIGEPGATVGYDPTIHQPAGSEPLTISPGGRVRVKFVGYRYHDEILRRAQVGPV
jgi:molecular chaperone GrpE (heat shock protein)